MADNNLPKLPPGYEYIKCIGSGGQGTVWLVVNKNMGESGRHEAVKILQPMSDKDQQRFRMEISTLASLSHPNILTIYFADPLQNYFIMEYLPKGSLANILSNPKISLLQKIKIFEQIAIGLAFAHSRGLVHRDLKPCNILFSQNMIPKITDFGLAKYSHQKEGITAQKISLGTPEYMAPEQWADSKEADHRSDIWSLGVILYEILAMRRPFIEKSLAALMHECIMKPVIAPHLVAPKLEELGMVIEPICLKCLEKDINKRYQHTQELLKDLQEALASPKKNISTTKTTIVTLPSKKIPKAPEESKIDFEEKEEDVSHLPTMVLEYKEKNTISKNKIFIACAAFLILLSAYFFLKPASFSSLRYDIEHGSAQKQSEALKILEKKGAKDSKLLSLIIRALNSENYGIRKQACSMIQKFGTSCFPFILEILEDTLGDYNATAKSEALNILKDLKIKESEEILSKMAKSRKIGESLQQMSVETLVEIFPEYKKEYHWHHGRWMTTNQLLGNGYALIEGKWTLSQNLFEPIIHALEENKKKLEELKAIPLQDLQKDFALAKIINSFSIESDVLKSYETCLEKYSSSLQNLNKFQDNDLSFALQKKASELEKEIQKGIEEIINQLSSLANHLEKKGDIAFSFLLCQKLSNTYEKILEWKWLSEKEIQNTWQGLQKEHLKKVQLLFQKYQIVVRIENKEKEIQKKLTPQIERSLVQARKVPLFILEEKEFQEHSPSLWLSFSYEEKEEKKISLKATSLQNIGQTVSLYSVNCHVACWQKENTKMPVWKTTIQSDEQEISDTEYSENLEKDLLLQSQNSFWENFQDWVLPWKQIEQIASYKKENTKISGSTFYEQTAQDKIYLKNGRKMEGLIEKEDEKFLYLLHFWKTSKGVSMSVRQTIEKEQIEKIERIPQDLREARLKIAHSEKSNELREKKNISNIALKSIPWSFSAGKDRGWEYTDKRFILFSNAERSFVQEIAFRLSKIFEAYEDFFQIDRNPDNKIKIYVFGSMQEYYNLLGGKILNPALYSPEKNYILAGCDLEKYQEEVQIAKKYHDDLKENIKKQEEKIQIIRRKIAVEKRKLHKELDLALQSKKICKNSYEQNYRNIQAWESEQRKILHSYEDLLKEWTDKAYFYDYKNKKMLDQYAGQMITLLYHESFHAFLENFLFSEAQLKFVPLWLHEGLAQFFENSFLEGDTLLIGQMDSKRLSSLKIFILQRKTIPLASFLVAESSQFLVKNQKDIENSSIHYLQAWAIVYYLAQNYNLRKGNFFLEYVHELSSGTSPLVAFQNLVQQPLDSFDESWKSAILKE